MNDSQSPSKFWSAVGIGLPAIATMMSFAAAFTTEQRAIGIGVGVVFAGVTMLALQRVNSASKK